MTLCNSSWPSAAGPVSLMVSSGQRSESKIFITARRSDMTLSAGKIWLKSNSGVRTIMRLCIFSDERSSSKKLCQDIGMELFPERSNSLASVIMKLSDSGSSVFFARLFISSVSASSPFKFGSAANLPSIA